MAKKRASKKSKNMVGMSADTMEASNSAAISKIRQRYYKGIDVITEGDANRIEAQVARVAQNRGLRIDAYQKYLLGRENARLSEKKTRKR